MPRLAVVGLCAATSLGGCVGGAVTFYEENDDLSAHGQDNAYYTQGARISRVFPAGQAPELLQAIADVTPLYDENERNAVGVVAGQHIYTPKDVESSELLPDDRPYAGWLYVGVIFAQQKMKSPDRTNDDQQTIEIDVGVVGDASLARWTQNHFHDLTGTDRAEGWDHQLGFEPGLVVTYERRHRLVDEKPLGLGFDVLSRYGASAGNVFTHANLGGTARLGFDLPRDFGVNTLSTTAMETSLTDLEGGPSFYLFGGLDGRAVARNLFLDGNTFRDSPSVPKDHLVAEASAGFAIQYRAFRLTYTWVTQSPEFHGQRGWTKYGSVSLGVFLDF